MCVHIYKIHLCRRFFVKIKHFQSETPELVFKFVKRILFVPSVSCLSLRYMTLSLCATVAGGLWSAGKGIHDRG